MSLKLLEKPLTPQGDPLYLAEATALLHAGGQFHSVNAYRDVSQAMFGPEREALRDVRFRAAASDFSTCSPSSDLLSAFETQELPLHLVIAREAAPIIELAPRRDQPGMRMFGLDEMCDEICRLVAQRLPKALEAYDYWFVSDMGAAIPTNKVALERLQVPGLGELTVTLQQQANGVFTNISQIQGPGFTIYNGRASGLQCPHPNDPRTTVQNRCLPSRVVIEALSLEINALFGHVDVQFQGLGFSKQSGITHDYKDDADYLPLSRERLADTSHSKVLKTLRKFAWALGMDPKNLEAVVQRLTQEKTLYEQFLALSKAPWAVSRSGSLSTATAWLAENVYQPLKEVAIPPEQKRTKLPTPYPKALGPLYLWIPQSEAAELLSPPVDASFVFGPIIPTIQLSIPVTELPTKTAAHWTACGRLPTAVSSAALESLVDPAGFLDPRSLKELAKSPGARDFLRNRNPICLVEIHPSSADGLFVVDSRKEATGQLQLLPETRVPAAEYRGDYANPVVLSARDFRADEIRLLDQFRFDVFEGQEDHAAIERRAANIPQIPEMPEAELEAWRSSRRCYIELGERLRVNGSSFNDAASQAIYKQALESFKPVLRAVIQDLVQTIQTLRQTDPRAEQAKSMNTFHALAQRSSLIASYLAAHYYLPLDLALGSCEQLGLIRAHEDLYRPDQVAFGRFDSESEQRLGASTRLLSQLISHTSQFTTLPDSATQFEAHFRVSNILFPQSFSSAAQDLSQVIVQAALSDEAPNADQLLEQIEARVRAIFRRS